MKLIKAEYDGYTRTFKLLNTHDAHKLQDGETYLFMDSSESDLRQDARPESAVREQGKPRPPALNVG